MHSFAKPLRRQIRPAASRVRRVSAPSRTLVRRKAASTAHLPDLSELILYGQG